MSNSIEVRYKCLCMDKEVALRVPARCGPAHDVVAWITDIVGVRIGADHKKRSPTCQSDSMDRVKIPVPPEDGYVGQAE